MRIDKVSAPGSPIVSNWAFQSRRFLTAGASQLGTFAVPVMLFVLALVAVNGVAEEPTQWRWDGVERVVVVGDVHGACDSLIEILRETKLIDQTLAWTGGATHLVMLGDIVDRGPDSREALNLIMRLQIEAEATGGRVHFVLGNHEVMNLVGELSYTNEQEFAAFSKDEDPKERKGAFKRTVMSSLSRNGDPKKMRKVFNKRYPPGYFGLRRAFAPDGLYGQWLLNQQILVVVNDVAFVHGGLSPTMLDFEADQFNMVAMGQLRRFMEAQQRLMDLDELTPEMSYQDQISELNEILKGGTADPEVLDLANTMFAAAEGLVFRRDGPLWYRGSALNPEDAERALVEDVLGHIGAARVVVGHTPVHTDRITTRFDGAVVLADTGMLTAHYGGRASAVVLQDGVLYETYHGEGPRVVSAQQWYQTPAMFASNEEVERFLESAPAVFMQDVGSGTTRPMEVWLADNGRRCRAAFKSVDAGSRRYSHEVAAYRLDRLLDHGMVPPTVVREIGGTTGSLQLWVENVINEEDRIAEDIPTKDPTELRHQQDHADVFDLLIFNIDRNGSNMLIDPSDPRVFLIDHEQAFKPSLPSPYHLEDARSKLDEDFRELLVNLDTDEMRTELGGYLTGEQIDALLQRRELLLDDDEVDPAHPPG